MTQLRHTVPTVQTTGASVSRRHSPCSHKPYNSLCWDGTPFDCGLRQQSRVADIVLCLDVSDQHLLMTARSLQPYLTLIDPVRANYRPGYF